MPKGGERFGAWFDAAAAAAAVAFFRTYLRHTEAEWWGRPFQLSPWQERIVRTVFGWKRGDGTRLVRTLYLEVPRKNGKTEFAAGLALLMLVADGEPGGQGYSMARDIDQARIVFNKAVTMVGLSPALAAVMETYKTSIYCPQLTASFKPLSSNAASKHGFSPSFAVADELHEWPDGELHDVVHKGTAARRQPLEILITTAGEPGVGYGWELHERAEQVLAGTVEDPSFLPFVFAASPSDDWTSPAAWAKANPNLGVSVKEDYLAAEVAAARGNDRKIGDFKRYHLNLWNEKVTAGLPMDQWDACCPEGFRPVTLKALAGRRCWGALDLSATTDLTALVLLASAGPGRWDAWWHFWMPTHDLRERTHRDRVPYQQWVADGHITGTEGNTVDYDAIRAFVSGGVGHDLVEGPPLAHQVDLAEIAIDRWNATQIVTQLGQDGVTVVPYGQGFASMSAPSKELLRLVGKGALNHARNPVARWMASNTAFEADRADNIKPVKPDRRASIKRIDGIVALIMALGRAVAPQEDAPVDLAKFLAAPVMVGR